jgi:hypothetical protein
MKNKNLKDETHRLFETVSEWREEDISILTPTYQ